MTTERKPLRSRKSYGRKDRDGFTHRRWVKSEGLPANVFDGRPVIGICNTWRPPAKYPRGYYRLYVQHVLQADQGCNLDFLTGASGSVVDRESH
jgi:dihydroxyacid dehydratase/phosphogluconate dehydratase